ncbi:MAG: hypothetical protein RR315_01420 [Oscillospiraceae bacterium]
MSSGKFGGAVIDISFWAVAFIAYAACSGFEMGELLLAAAIHEGGHLAALKFLGGEIREVKIGLMGIGMKAINHGIRNLREEILLNLAGPLAGLWGGILAYMLHFKEFGDLSLCISLFNLLPIRGLDGGAALNEALENRYGEKGEKIAAAISVLTLLTAAAGFIYYMVFIFLP